FTLGRDSVDRSMPHLLGPEIIPQILNAGFNFDFIDDRAIAKVGIPYHIVILPGVERMPVATAEKLRDYVAHGGIVIATRCLPSLAPGLLQQKTGTPQLRKLIHKLFARSNPHARLISSDSELSAALRRSLKPDFAVASDASAIGFVHRKLPNAEIYFVANTSNTPVDTTATVCVHGLGAEWWNPFTAKITSADATPNGKTTQIPLHLAPYESRVLVFARGLSAPLAASSTGIRRIDLSTDWTVTFPPLHRTVHMDRLHSWTDDPQTHFYSGVAVYGKAAQIPSDNHFILDFGKGIPVTRRPTRNGTRAWLESPVREAAVVYVNGKKAGSVWHPPYQLDITGLLHPGSNQLRIVVGNLAINELVGKAPPNYRLLNLRYGNRFSPEGGRIAQPLPSGLLGPVTLLAR
ncbi:MAG: glycosylhydrolase-like jelly roll fold domain-containing protein, partial [Terriglobia bacterium]